MSAEISVYEKQLIHEIEETPQEYIPKLPIIVWSTRTPPHILCAHQARDHKRAHGCPAIHCVGGVVGAQKINIKINRIR